MKTALVVVDFQNDFVEPAGALYVPGAQMLVDRIDRLAELYDDIVFTKDWHSPADPSFEAQGGLWPVHCVADTRGSDVSANLHRAWDRASMVLHKRSNSAFLHEGRPTGLGGYLRERGVSEVHFCGVALDYCVWESARDARRAGFSSAIVLRATKAVTEEGFATTTNLCESEGVVIL